MFVLSRVSSLKKAVDQRNRALMCLNEAMNVSCVLLASREGPRPISCTTATAWSRAELQDVLTATCRLQNGSGFSLDRGWTWCVRVRTCSRASDPDSAGSAATYTIPVDRLGPGDRREVTLPLGPGEDGALDLPVTVSCALHYSLREVVGGALAPPDSSEDPSLEGCPPDVLPEQDGVCLPLSEHTLAWPRPPRGPPARAAPLATLWTPSWERASGRAANRPDPLPCGPSSRPRRWPPSRCQQGF